MIVIGLTGLEMCMKMLRNFSQEFGAKSPSSTLGYSVLSICCLADAFSGTPGPKASLEKGQQLD